MRHSILLEVAAIRTQLLLTSLVIRNLPLVAALAYLADQIAAILANRIVVVGNQDPSAV